MAWSFSSHHPVYYQIAEKIRRSVLSGEYPPGAQIPSVRQIAIDAAVNPNTVQHAFGYLEDLGIIESRGTLGRFVTNDSSVIEECRRYEAELLVGEFIKSVENMRIPIDDIIDMIRMHYINDIEKEEENGTTYP